MPAKPRWLLQITEIVSILGGMSAPVMDRSAVEKLFGLRRRQAIELMKSFGGYQAGNTILIDRMAMITRLREIHESPAFTMEFRRRERIGGQLDELRRSHRAREVRIPVPPCSREPRMSDLDETIELRTGRLTVAYSNTEELLTKLYLLSQAAANDFDAFCSMVESRSR